MSRTNYYYESEDSNKIIIEEPGELCDGCKSLRGIVKAGTLVPMPLDGLHEEYESEAGNVHMHVECAIAAREEYARCYKEADAAITAFRQKVFTLNQV